MSFDFSTLVTDRSQADLDTLRALLAVPLEDWTAEQLAEFNQAISKGSYNYADLNRVTACMDYLNEVLTGLGYETGYQRIAVPHQDAGGRLPSGYTELQYIESTGTQYINTGVNPTQSTRIVLSIQTQQVGRTLCGADVGWIPNNGLALGPTFAHYGTQSCDNIPGINDGQPHVVELGAAKLLLDTVTVYSFAEQTFSVNYPIALCANNRAGSIEEFVAMAIMSAKIYNGENLMRDFLPCMNSSGAVGLYDLISDQFYGNSGSGAFVAGPEVPPPEPEPALDPYTWYEDDIPTVTLMTAYLANVEALRGVIALPEGTPEVPADMARMTLAEANAIEEVLDYIHVYLTALASVFRRCGPAICGGPGFYFQN